MQLTYDKNTGLYVTNHGAYCQKVLTEADGVFTTRYVLSNKDGLFICRDGEFTSVNEKFTSVNESRVFIGRKCSQCGYEIDDSVRQDSKLCMNCISDDALASCNDKYQ